METQLLRDQQIFPTKPLLKNVLGDSCYDAFEELITTIEGDKYALDIEWKYYNDGKAWLCKASYKKRTVFWLSVWDKYFKMTFYFTEKKSPGIAELDIDPNLKEEFSRTKPTGRLIPLTLRIIGKEQIRDVLRIIDYKKSLK